jgi:pimeloyl-ACP methyl ester carboxylesterase
VIAVVGHEAGVPIHMAYSEAGDPEAGRHILLVHGLFDHRGTWSYLIPQLATAGFHVIAPDLIGFGGSSRPMLADLPVDERYSIDTQVGFLRSFIAELGLDDFVLMGNSFGGAVVLRTLCTPWRQAPRIRALILESAVGRGQTVPPYIEMLAGAAGRLLLIRWILSLVLTTGAARWLTQRTFRRAFHDPGRIPPELLDAAVDVLRIPDTLYAYRESARNLVPADIASFPERFRDIDIPTLILWGRDDCIVPPIFGLLFEEEIPNSTLHVFDECGHAPHLELPVETAVVIRDWVRRPIANKGLL